MQWKSGCGHLGSHELQRGGGSTSIVGRAAGKKGIVTPSMCPAVQTPTDLVPGYCTQLRMCIEMYFGIAVSGEHLTYCDVPRM